MYSYHSPLYPLSSDDSNKFGIYSGVIADTGKHSTKKYYFGKESMVKYI